MYTLEISSICDFYLKYLSFFFLPITDQMTLSHAQRDKEILLEKIWKITFSEKIEWNTSWKSQGNVFVCEKNNNNKKNQTNKTK